MSLVVEKYLPLTTKLLQLAAQNHVAEPHHQSGPQGPVQPDLQSMVEQPIQLTAHPLAATLQAALQKLPLPP
jgi:hypothetical protein